MAAIDFPNSPTLNQEFTANGRTWIWNGTVWANKVSNTSVSRYTVQDTAPTSPASGDVWFNSTNARTYVYYDSFWVESNPALDGKSGVSAVASPITNSGTQSAAVLGLDYNALQYGQNAIINGAFDIWQRGTSFTPVASSAGYIADRFNYYRDGSGSTLTFTRETFTLGTAPVSGYEGQYYLRANQTVAGTSGTENLIQQYVEDVRSFAGQTVTVSFWAKADAARTLQSQIQQYFGSGGSSRVDQTAVSHSLTTSWARYTSTFTLPAVTGKTIAAGSYLTLAFRLPLNTTQTIDIWGVQLEAGSTATPFKRNAPSLQAELATCQRYYWRYQPNIQYKIMSQLGIAQGTTQFVTVLDLPVTMRSAPTSIESAGLYIWQRDYSVGDVDANISSLQIGYGAPNLCEIIANTSSLTNKATGYIRAALATGYIGLSAEL